MAVDIAVTKKGSKPIVFIEAGGTETLKLQVFHGVPWCFIVFHELKSNGRL